MIASSSSRLPSSSVTTVPRVSSPLASQSTTASSQSSQSSSEGENGDGDSDDDDMDSDEDDDDDDDLEQLLQAAKSNARARAAGTSLDSAIDQTGLGDINLADMDDSNNRLAAIFTQPAIASQVFDLTSLSKGKARQVTTNPEDLPILSGTTDKWGEMPRAKSTKSSKKALKQGSDVAKGWFDMPRRTLDSLSNEEKREIQALRLSNAMDPKRFMRGQSKRENKKMPEYFQMGHVVDDSASKGPRAGMQAPSSKDKRATFMAGLLDDNKGRAYVNRKYAEVQQKAQSGGRGYAKKRAKDRKGTFGQRGGSGGKKTRR